ncbi:hypothetical protein CCMA1212_003721 [Trichoderma ghanense]|uniref:Uncharacterized protein n=1 Tax=Trichoderma ghanense TaxID=65468 RepID=A0ABY2H716_9HYPO
MARPAVGARPERTTPESMADGPADGLNASPAATRRVMRALIRREQNGMRPGSPIWELERTGHRQDLAALEMDIAVTAQTPTHATCGHEEPSGIQARTVQAVRYGVASPSPSPLLNRHRRRTANSHSTTERRKKTERTSSSSPSLQGLAEAN